MDRLALDEKESKEKNTRCPPWSIDGADPLSRQRTLVNLRRRHEQHQLTLP